jgi:hypothetical protein
MGDRAQPWALLLLLLATRLVWSTALMAGLGARVIQPVEAAHNTGTLKHFGNWQDVPAAGDGSAWFSVMCLPCSRHSVTSFAVSSRGNPLTEF